jgi:hypothetical protein
MEKNVLEIRSRAMGEFEYGIDFQETPKAYRQKRIEVLKARYPESDFAYSWK